MTGKNDAVNESLSALFDGEHSELDMRRVLKAEDATSVNAQWSSYQLTRQVLQKEATSLVSADFLSGIQDAIANESTQRDVPSSARFAWSQYGGKFAIAACVTLAFLVGANQWNLGTPDSVVPSAELAASKAAERHESMAVVPSGFELPPLNARTVSNVPSAASASSVRMQAIQPVQQSLSLSPEQQEMLKRLMLKHAESASANGGLGVIPFARVGSVTSDQK